MRYIFVQDNSGNRNLWSIQGENNNTYLVSTRTTTAFLDKSKCFLKDTSPLLWTDEIRDVEESNIDLECLDIELKCSKCLHCNVCDDKFYDCEYFDDYEEYEN